MLAFKRLFNVNPRSKNCRELFRSLTGLHNVSDVDTRDLLGKPCELLIEHAENAEGVAFANVDCKPWRGGKDAPAPASPLVFFSLVARDFNSDVLAGLSERRREKILASETYKALIAERKGTPGKAVAEVQTFQAEATPRQAQHQ